MVSASRTTSSHALLATFAANGIDRIYLVPGESFLGLLDALADFPDIDVVTCRHEGGAAFMACAEARVARRPAVVMVSRGPGASNAVIGIHTAQQDGLPVILVVGQVPKRDLRRRAFQEIDYGAMYGGLAKWVVEVTDPAQLQVAGSEALRVSMSGTPGPVVLAVTEDVQQQEVEARPYAVTVPPPAPPSAATVREVGALLREARRPLVIAGGALADEGGRAALRAVAEAHGLPVALSFRRHDLFPNAHPLYVGDLGLANPADQIEAFQSSDLILALGTRLDDITTQGFTFPDHPRPRQTVVHCHPDHAVVGRRLAVERPLACDPIALARMLTAEPAATPRAEWIDALRAIHRRIADWASVSANDGVPPVDIARALHRHAPRDLVVCLDAGSFAAPVYRHFPFEYPQLLMAPLSGAMGYGVPAAVACALREHGRQVVCLVGDGGFCMTGSEMIVAAERRLPVLFVVANNGAYGSIRIHQAREYPGRHRGTSLANPDFAAIGRAFGIASERIDRVEDIDDAIARGLSSGLPHLIEVRTSLSAVLPKPRGVAAG
jgi:acetolactate synthase I/II/III large subunit